MSFTPNDLYRWLLLIETTPEVNKAAVETKRRELNYRGAGSVAAMGLGVLFIAFIALAWILKLAGVF